LAEALKIAAERFDEFARTAGFTMGVEELGSVVDDDRLAARNEEVVWEVKWMKGAAGVAGWRDGVGKFRFPLMREEYVGSCVLGMVGGDGEWMTGVLAEALRAKAARREVWCSNSKCWGRRR
jgi:hypothetical protein